ncbi:MAG TPA: hypothetical protein VLY23_08040 [Candidatus Acidoferrum sp.]|nr:hypothetical protein [Candidatus Acidoferrum sp.]
MNNEDTFTTTDSQATTHQPDSPQPRRQRPRNTKKPQALELVSAAERHRRKCAVCSHAERQAIEEEFLDWHGATGIANRYGLSHKSTVYAHARATGLYARRRDNVRHSLEHIIEQAATAKVTADAVIRAVRAYTCITDEGKWVEPAAHVIVSSGSALPYRTAPPTPTAAITVASLEINEIAQPAGVPLAADQELQGEIVYSNPNLSLED